MSLLLLAGFGSSAQAQTWTGKSIGAAKDSTVYLWNVGARKFLGKGAKWGTQATISTVGTPFKVTTQTSGSTTRYILESLTKGQGSSTTNGALGFTNGKNSVHDKGTYFVDRPSSDDSSYGTRYFTFTADGTNETYYKIAVKSTSGENGYTGIFYLFANMTDGEQVVGVSSVPIDSTAYSQWIVVTEQERQAAFYNAEASTSSAVPATFLISDQDFARNDNSISSWKAEGASASYTSNGSLTNYTTKVKKPTEANSTSDSYKYYVGNGYTDSDISATSSSVYIDPLTGDTIDTANDYKNRQAVYGGDWTANIHGVSGKVYQTITPLRAGWYKVSCVGFTTDKAVLYAQVGSSTTGKQYATDSLVVLGSDAIPTTYVAASRLINDVNASYDKSVMVYVPAATDGGTLANLTFGIIVANASDTAWTCFDNFQLDYLGDPQYNLVLDEDQTDGDYIKAQGQQKDANNADYTGKKTLYLHRTLNENKWNSIVLPVTLTVGQVKSAFGDQVRISAFKGAIEEDHPGRIIFQKISANRDEANDTAIVAGNLYLIKPTKLDYTTGGEEKTVEDYDISITGYYTIPGVVFNCTSDANYSSRVEGGNGKETYEGDTQVQFVGTYVKLGDENKIPANSYVLNGNNVGGTAGVWYYRTVETASKGFRGWLQQYQSESGNTGAKKLTYMLEGVEEELGGGTTSIDNLVDGDMVGKKLSGNIYNLNGQLVRTNTTSLEGLAKGVYVVGGKKMIVK